MKPENTLKHSKDPNTLLKLKNSVVYHVNCKDCGPSYVGETGLFFSTRCREHKRVVDSWKPNRSTLFPHAFSNENKIDWVNTKSLAQENDNYKHTLFGVFYIN